MRPLDPLSESTFGKFLRDGMEERVVGQESALNSLVAVYEKFRSKLFNRTRPIGSLLFLGPTGSGKTRVCEAFNEVLFKDARHCLKIDCGEYQHSSDIAKLVGSPPGYLGHRETKPLFSIERIKSLIEEGKQGFAVLIFDEIEKSSDALWHLLLGVLDKGIITNGYNEEVDLTKTVILMTSNAGSEEMSFALGNRLGFVSAGTNTVNDAEIADIGVKAAKRKFTTEFINRIDHVVACNALTREQTRRVIDIELKNLQKTLFICCPRPVFFTVTEAAKSAILEQGYDPTYNARNVRRAIEQNIQVPLSRILTTEQCGENDAVFITYEDGSFRFFALPELTLPERLLETAP